MIDPLKPNSFIVAVIKSVAKNVNNARFSYPFSGSSEYFGIFLLFVRVNRSKQLRRGIALI